MLKIFDKVTEEISAEKYVSISKVLVLTKIMKTHVERCLIAESDNSNNSYQELLEALRSQLHDKFRDIESQVLATEASFLDPRFKKHAFVNKDKYENCLRSIKDKLRMLLLQEDAIQINRNNQPKACGSNMTKK